MEFHNLLGFEMGWLSIFLLGLLGGVHCVGMCGGIVGALTLGLPDEMRGGWRMWPYLLAYNAGRITSYVLAGTIAGGLGWLLAGFLPVQLAQNLLLGFAGIFMVLLGLYLSGWWPVLSRLEALGGALWRRIEPWGRGLMPVRNVRQALLLGMLWGWVPCGMVYGALVGAVSAGGPLSGGAWMLAFGLGTLPNLLLMGAAAGWLARWVRHPLVRTLAGTLVLAMGVMTLLRAAQGLWA